MVKMGSVEQQLTKLQEDIRRLKIDFNLYVHSTAELKRAPHEARGRVEALIKRLSDDRSLTFQQKYQLNNIASSYTSLRELWRRTLRQKGEIF